MKKIGVFVCHCGINIAQTVDIEKVVQSLKSQVQFITDYKYLCSDPGQDIVKNAVKEYQLECVVIAACSPTLHENTFRRAVSSVGLNPYLCEIANIREQCSWVHKEKNVATEKAIKIIKSITAKTKLNLSLSEIKVPVTKRALVIGGGIAGIQSAIDIANSGYEVILVEKSASIGGRMAQLSETFPTLDCSQCILTPKMVECEQHPKIKLYTYSEIEEVKGYVGNFEVKIKQKAACLDRKKCTGCGLCIEKCPVKILSEFDAGLGKRKAIYTLFPQAVPNKPVIDKEHCLYLKTRMNTNEKNANERESKGKCRVCERICPAGAIDFTQQDIFSTEKVGAIVVATGFDLFPKENIGEYGYGKYPDVIDGLQFERLLSASGPTKGEVLRPSDSKIPQKIVFIQCAGSRDTENGVPYCSKICCMYTAKHATLYKHRVHNGQAYIFYIDIRSGGKGYEEFVQRVQEQDRVTYYRGKVSKVFQDDGEMVVKGVDTLSGLPIEISADMVVLATAIVSNQNAKELAKKLKTNIDQNGFLTEAHPKLRPVESLTAGVFLAGCAQAPKDIPETVAQASASAGKVASLFSADKLSHEPTVAKVDEEKCSGCRICISVCPYDAREYEEEGGKKIVKVNEVLCEGCGSCVSACPSGATTQCNLTDEQIFAMTEAVLMRT
ncbi:MAG: CoB--CoM heterodisulfide reductase iron-sulfur subunit A family protein [Elusimicrobiota bacterium]